MRHRITKFAPAQIAAVMELRESGLYWHEIAHRYRVRAQYLQSCVRRAEKYGLEAFGRRAS